MLTRGFFCSLYMSTSHAYTFGGGHDLYCNSAFQSCYSNFGHSWWATSLGGNCYGATKCRNWVSGSYQWNFQGYATSTFMVSVKYVWEAVHGLPNAAKIIKRSPHPWPHCQWWHHPLSHCGRSQFNMLCHFLGITVDQAARPVGFASRCVCIASAAAWADAIFFLCVNQSCYYPVSASMMSHAKPTCCLFPI